MSIKQLFVNIRSIEMYVLYKRSIEQKRSVLLFENPSTIQMILKIIPTFYYLIDQMDSEVTIFDKIVQGVIKANVVYEDELVLLLDMQVLGLS
ncbi:hypothetical protein FGO68_gene10104 [Halteria grandinella]|uniref:Uncharacterized protein n=1 Tax=Halteria grandinella TaxID=5974 RepID=A0A8J8NA14_HALGN|nr:hypothetical protein FGO68_gene10104 [Halteria grandinella]